MTEAKTGPEMLEEIAEDPTLDSFFDGDPRTKDIPALIRVLRAERAQFIDGKGKGRAKEKETTDDELA